MGARFTLVSSLRLHPQARVHFNPSHPLPVRDSTAQSHFRVLQALSMVRLLSLLRHPIPHISSSMLLQHLTTASHHCKPPHTSHPLKVTTSPAKSPAHAGFIGCLHVISLHLSVIVKLGLRVPPSKRFRPGCA